MSRSRFPVRKLNPGVPGGEYNDTLIYDKRNSFEFLFFCEHCRIRHVQQTNNRICRQSAQSLLPAQSLVLWNGSYIDVLSLL